MDTNNQLPFLSAEELILRRAEQLIKDAEALCVVLEISTVPQQPLAMGNYSMQASVRDKDYRPKMEAERLAREAAAKENVVQKEDTK